MREPAALDVLSRRGLIGAAGGALILPEAAFAQPRRGGRIRVATMSSSTADTLDPAKGALSTDYARHYMLYSGLVLIPLFIGVTLLFFW